jgi:sensor histidine kinase YesM
MKYTCNPNVVYEYTPNGRKNLDRPRKRWRDKRWLVYILFLSMTIFTRLVRSKHITVGYTSKKFILCYLHPFTSSRHIKITQK